MPNPLDRSWMPQGICAQVDMNMHHPAADEQENRLRPRQPVDLCRTCPVINRCEEYVMTLELGWPRTHRAGVWAAMYPHERVAYEPQWLAEGAVA